MIAVYESRNATFFRKIMPIGCKPIRIPVSKTRQEPSPP